MSAVTPLTVPVGYEPSATDMQSWIDFMNQNYVDYGSSTTLLTATTTNPTLGNSVYTARYAKYGYSVLWAVDLTIGSTFVAGSGFYRMLLPVAANATFPQSAAMAINESGVALRSGGIIYVDSTHVSMFYDAAGNVMSNAGLSTSWTTGDRVSIAGFYQAAAI